MCSPIIITFVFVVDWNCMSFPQVWVYLQMEKNTLSGEESVDCIYLFLYSIHIVHVS